MVSIEKVMIIVTTTVPKNIEKVMIIADERKGNKSNDVSWPTSLSLRRLYGNIIFFRRCLQIKNERSITFFLAKPFNNFFLAKALNNLTLH